MNLREPEPRGPVPGLAGRVLSRLYAAELRRRNRRFDRGEGVIELDRPVISIGNISAGGTGKTPMVAHIAHTLLRAGHRPCIAMRGYRPGPDGRSDEAAFYQRSLPEVPVIAQPDRVAGLLRLFASPVGERVDCILLDDGFQHRRLARALDLVLIDATRPPFDDELLPAGWLREPAENLARASGIVLTHAESAGPGETGRLRARLQAAGLPVVAVTSHVWTGLDIDNAGQERTEAASWLTRRRVFSVCAIGNPGPFVRAAEQAAGGRLTGRMILRDHDAYGPATLRRLRRAIRDSGAEVLLTTAKDWPKLSRQAWDLPIVRPRLTLRFEEGEETLRNRVMAALAGPARGP